MSGVEEIIIALLVQMHIISEINRVPVVEGRGYKFDRSWEPKFYNIVNLYFEQLDLSLISNLRELVQCTGVG